MTNMTLEEAFARLGELLGRMQDRDLPLEESFALYQEGMNLVKYCNDSIDRVEKKVIAISGAGEDAGI